MKIHNKSEESIKDAIGRLASFSPSTTDDYGHQLIDYIILDCASDFGNTVVSPKDVKKISSINFYLNLPRMKLLLQQKD